VHFTIPGYNNSRLDCMFFPCTVDDKPVITKDILKNKGLYLDRPTFIMCNPNALLY
jgi:hypothetical protein